MLQAAGIGAAEERVYRLLVAVRVADAAAVADQLGLDAAHTHELLASLHDKGLVGQVPVPPEGGVVRYVPVAPDAALSPLLLRGQEALEEARRGVDQLSEEYRAGGRRHDAQQLVEVITGAGVIRQRLRHMAYGAVRMRWLCKAHHVALSAEENAEEWELLARGVRYQAIYERALLEEPGMVDNVARSIRAGEEARAAGALPVRLVIADDSVAICPLMSGSSDGSNGSFGEATAAVVRSSSLLDALIALFESQWVAASPLHVTDTGQLADFGGDPRPGANVADDERYLLSLVVAGVADKAIASQLQVSQRTVQRRIQVLMQRVGAVTRTQLVWQAARRGWLT
ncbi:helix-turn-helix domain-containing protein [Streptomyces sp. NPDC054863]